MEKDVKKKLLDRLSRAEGQIRALRTILQDEEKQDCKKFISQIKAARSALRSVSEQYVITHIHHCHSLSKEDRESKITEAIKILANN